MRHNWESNPRFSCLCFYGFPWTHYGPKVDGRKKSFLGDSKLFCASFTEIVGKVQKPILSSCLCPTHTDKHTQWWVVGDGIYTLWAGCPGHTIRLGGSQEIKMSGGQRKIEQWEKLRDRKKLWCMICDKSSWAVKAFELTLVWTGRSPIWRVGNGETQWIEVEQWSYDEGN